MVFKNVYVIRVPLCMVTLELSAPQQAAGELLAGSLPIVCDQYTMKMTWNTPMDTAFGLYYRRKVTVIAKKKFKKRQKATKQ